MAKLDFYYDGKKVNEEITNWRDLEVTITFDNNRGQGVVETGSLEFVAGLAEKINNWNSQGMFGGPGIFEAPPFRIDVCGVGSTIFDGGVNTAECVTSYECDKVVAPLRSNAIDFINDRATSFTIAYLASLPSNAAGKINQSDYVLVPYVINTIPNYINVIVAGISLFTIIKEFKSIIEQIVKAIKKLIGHASAAVIAFIPPATFAGVAIAVGLVLVDIVTIVLLVAYIAFLIAAIIELIIMLFENLIQRVKYKKGMRVVDMFRKASEYLGFKFSSTILESAPHKDEVLIPEKNAYLDNKVNVISSVFGYAQTQKSYDDKIHPTSVGWFDGTFADLILLYEDRFNAEVRITNDTLHFETKEQFASFSNYTLPNIKGRNADPHGTNACELSASYIITHALDPQDTNTSDLYEGTSAEMILSPIIVQNRRNVLLKGLTEKNLNMALAKTKRTLNPIESLFASIYDSLYQMIGGTNSNFSSVLNTIGAMLKKIKKITGGSMPVINLLNFPSNPFVARAGVMMLSSDFIGVQKVLIVDSNNKLASNNDYLTSAQYLMDKFHFTNFAIRTKDSKGTIKNDHGQWLTYTDKEIPFCCDDYLKVLNNNFIKTYDQKIAKIKTITWNPYKGTAKATYSVKQQYTNNLKQSYVIDGK